MEVDPTPRPLGLVIVALIAALVWGLVAPGLGADNGQPGSRPPPTVTTPS